MMFSHEGMMPDPKKTEALSHLPFPSNVKEMQSFLGMCNCLGRFTRQLASMTTPLRQLIKKSNAFAPMLHHHIAFKVIINEISMHTILNYYRPDLDLVLECDASIVAVSMTLIQDFSQEPGSFGIEFLDVTCLKPLALASKTLTPTTQYYANIKREILAVVSGF